jgi:hypothetical protein
MWKYNKYMQKFFHNFYNHIDFQLRNVMKLSRGAYCPFNELKDNLFEDFDDLRKIIAEKKEQEYLEKYYLQRLKDHSTKRIYLENLNIIEFLENYINFENNFNKIEILDIGSKNWFYAEGEYNFFKYHFFEKNIEMTGIEIDAHRLYTDFHSRRDYALYYIKNLDNCRYIAGDVMLHKNQYDYITWFFPFVTQEPLLNWGLPLKFYKPEKMLKHAFSLLKPNGKLIIVNQGKEEYLKQQELLKKLNIPYSQKGTFTSSFLDFSFERYVILLQK